MILQLTGSHLLTSGSHNRLCIELYFTFVICMAPDKAHIVAGVTYCYKVITVLFQLQPQTTLLDQGKDCTLSAFKHTVISRERVSQTHFYCFLLKDSTFHWAVQSRQLDLQLSYLNLCNQVSINFAMGRDSFSKNMQFDAFRSAHFRCQNVPALKQSYLVLFSLFLPRKQPLQKLRLAVVALFSAFFLSPWLSLFFLAFQVLWRGCRVLA